MVGRRCARTLGVRTNYKRIDRRRRQCGGPRDFVGRSKSADAMAYDRCNRNTALGSITLVVLFSAFTLVVLLVLRDRLGALQMLAASVGAGILTLVTKDIIERTRPEVAQQLIAVSGFSYPSGHSLSTSALYLTIAIIAGRYVQHLGARVAVFIAVSAVVIMVGASRVYLGVHYATDVVSGISLGAVWALMLAGFFTLLGHRRSP